MADEKTSDTPSADEVEQLEFEFPSPEDYPSFDDVDSDEGQAQLPDDSFDESGVSTNEDETGCCVR